MPLRGICKILPEQSQARNGFVPLVIVDKGCPTDCTSRVRKMGQLIRFCLDSCVTTVGANLSPYGDLLKLKEP